ncbi:MAG: 30S ribosomal protein S2, partial [Holdemanella biformis]|nr:30S ribosomal protein S2 [Holdemanella biformis]
MMEEKRKGRTIMSIVSMKKMLENGVHF